MDSLKNVFHNTLAAEICQKLCLNAFKRRWRTKNHHNLTEAMCIFDDTKVTVGNESYGELNIIAFNNKSSLVIGTYCSIAPNVQFILDADHQSNIASTYPFKVALLKSEKMEAVSKGDIIVDDDVWIGHGATIMSGVHIGQGAVVAAGAVVTKDVPPYAIVGSVPARIIKYRFSEDLIAELLKIDYSKLTKELVEVHIDNLYAELTDIKQLDWMPRK